MHEDLSVVAFFLTPRNLNKFVEENCCFLGGAIVESVMTGFYCSSKHGISYAGQPYVEHVALMVFHGWSARHSFEFQMLE